MALVLSRKPGERILVGDDIVLTIVKLTPNSVKIGIEAPQHLDIVREELVAHVPGPPQCRCDDDGQCEFCAACRKARETLDEEQP